MSCELEPERAIPFGVLNKTHGGRFPFLRRRERTVKGTRSTIDRSRAVVHCKSVIALAGARSAGRVEAREWMVISI